MVFLHSDMVQRRRAVALAGIAAGVLAIGAVASIYIVGNDGQGPSGSGFTYRGDFYAMSGAEIRPDRLGPVIDRDVPIMDTTTDVREVLGIDAETAVAARVVDIGGSAAEDGAAWLLMSPDPEVAADPWAHSEVAGALIPR